MASMASMASMACVLCFTFKFSSSFDPRPRFLPERRGGPASNPLRLLPLELRKARASILRVQGPTTWVAQKLPVAVEWGPENDPGFQANPTFTSNQSTICESPRRESCTRGPLRLTGSRRARQRVGTDRALEEGWMGRVRTAYTRLGQAQFSATSYLGKAQL